MRYRRHHCRLPPAPLLPPLPTAGYTAASLPTAIFHFSARKVKYRHCWPHCLPPATLLPPTGARPQVDKTATYYTTRLAGLMTSSLRHMSKISRVVYQNCRADVTSPNMPTLTRPGENPATYRAVTEILAQKFFLRKNLKLYSILTRKIS